MINWETKGKTIKQIINELSTFEDQDIEVCISLDSGDNKYPVSLIGKIDNKCVLMYCNPNEE